MTIDEAINHCLEVAEQNDFETRIYDELNRSGDEEYRNNHCQCAADHRQLAEWLKELKEAKRLLKAAINDIYKECTCNDWGCGICEYLRETCDIDDDRFKWRYADEAEKLLKEG